MESCDLAAARQGQTTVCGRKQDENLRCWSCPPFLGAQTPGVGENIGSRSVGARWREQYGSRSGRGTGDEKKEGRCMGGRRPGGQPSASARKLEEAPKQRGGWWEERRTQRNEFEGALVTCGQEYKGYGTMVPQDPRVSEGMPRVPPPGLQRGRYVQVRRRPPWMV